MTRAAHEVRRPAYFSRLRVFYLVLFASLCASCGGNQGSSAAPARNSTVPVPGLMTDGRVTRAVTLKSGDVLEVAGFGSFQAVLLASGEVYHAGSDSFSRVSNQLETAANRVCLAALPDGTALEAGGID